MKRLILTSFAIMFFLATPAVAQQAGENINVLPVVDPNLFPDWWLLGDGYLQRQVEPTIAASTRNPDHLLAFFNDYRAIDVLPEEDLGLGEGQQIVMVFNTVKMMMAALPPWSQIPALPVPPPIAAAEAWVGMSRSYDGGLTWSGGFLPGAPFDLSPASLASPVNGLEAATDPVVVAGPCGKFYVVFVAFTRGDASSIAVARYEDLNNNPGGDTIVYLDTTVIETGNNAEYGFFLDKPDLEIDIMRPLDSEDQCSHRLYATYSTFNGLTKEEKIQTKMKFAMSEDGGLSFSTQKINGNWGQNQGSVIAVDPRDGTPKKQTGSGGGTVYVFWRHFFDPDTIVMTKTLDYGNKWTKPAAIIGSGSIEAFDQPTISTTTAVNYGLMSDLNPTLPETAFRSNGFPTAAVSAGGNVFAAWQERVDLNSGLPDPGGPPRIVLTSSSPGGANWSAREAVDFGTRDYADTSSPPAPTGFGTLPEERVSGPQVMPQLSFGGERLMLAYYESRGRILDYGTPSEDIFEEIGTSTVTDYISGYDRLLDFRAALLHKETGQFISSAQVSRYPLSAGADLGDGEDLIDVAPINPPCAPDHSAYYPSGTILQPCVRQVNRVNAPTSAAGTSPFIGDYVGLEPFVRFVVDGNGVWSWATHETDLPTPGFHSIWTDNRHLIPPPKTWVPGEEPEPGTWDATSEWQGFVNYAEPEGGLPSCINTGSRNTDVLTSRVDADLIINAPTTYLSTSQDVRFPFSISNQTAETKTYTLNIDPIVGGTSFLPEGAPGAPEATLDVEIFPYSSTAQVVYVPQGVTDPITVTVDETGACSLPLLNNCQSGSITFNAADSMANYDSGIPTTGQVFNPTVDGDAFVINHNPDNAFVINQNPESAFVINPTPDNAFVINAGDPNAFVINAFVINAFVINAFVINGTAGEEPIEIHDVIDTTWTVTPGASTGASSFLPLINIDNAEYFLDDYVFQLIIHKGSLYGGTRVDVDGNPVCNSTNIEQSQVLSTFAQGPGNEVTPETAFVINPAPKNAFVINQGLGNAFVINSTFTMAPSDDLPDEQSSAFTKNGSVYVSNDGTLKAPRAPDHVKVTLRAYQITDDDSLPIDPITGEQYKYNPDPNAGGAEPSAVFMELSCDPEGVEECIDRQGPDLIIAKKEELESTTIQASPCDTFDLPFAFTLRNRGYKEARPRIPYGDEVLRPDLNGIMRHAIFLSSDPILNLKKDPTDPNSTADEMLVEFFSKINPLGGENEPVPPVDFEELFGIDTATPISVSLPSHTAEGDYVIIVMDWPLQVSEFDETNNTVAIPLNIIPIDAPEALPATFKTSPGVELVENLYPVYVLNPNGYAPLEYSAPINLGPSNGTVFMNSATGEFTYTPNAGFVGVDTFKWIVSYCDVDSDPAPVTIEVLPNCDWVFVGLKSPLNGALYTANAGSVVPLTWKYVDSSSTSIDSSGAYPLINFKGWPGTCSDYDRDDDPTVNFDLEDPGSSELRYVNGTWTFNWQSQYPEDNANAGDPLPIGCYEITITLRDECVGKTDGNGDFQVYLK